MKFKCLLSNCVYEFTEPHDIETLKTHPQYEVVSDEVAEPKTPQKKTAKE